MSREQIVGVEAFLNHCFDAYTREGLTPQALKLVHRDMTQLDRALGNAAVPV